MPSRKNTMKTFLLTAVTVTLVAGAAFASPRQGATIAAPKPAAKKAAAPLICPVTGDKIASADKAYSKETYKGKTYYFCCPGCKPRFDKNRDAVIASAAKGKYAKM